MNTPEFFPSGSLVSVLTAQPIDRFLDYKAPAEGCVLGAFVEVPLGPRKVLGVVWGAGQGGFDYAKVRSVIRVVDVPAMRSELRDFLVRSADYTLTPLSAMLRLATRAPGLMDQPSMRVVYRACTPPQGFKVTSARQKVFDTLVEYGGAPFTLSELAQIAGVSTSVIKGMAEQRALLAQNAPKDMPFAKMDPDFGRKDLTDDQSSAAAQLRDLMATGDFGATLLRGVTGSGKTEVYLEAVAECLRRGKQALVLLPEIALTAEFLTRVRDRFGALPAEWHSGVTMTDRRRIWKMVAENGAQVVIGARSALFLPFQNLGLIVVDEEHEKSYKQEDGVLYNARDMAVLRAALGKAHVVLASATPSLETWVNATNGKYNRIDLTARYGAAVMPDMRAIDMRIAGLPATRWISDELVQNMQSRIAQGEQVMLFINRRGYAPVTLCRACGQQIGCDHCDASMVEHRFQNRLMCHQCGETKPIPSECPHCHVADRLAPIGPGVERLAEEAQSLFPKAKVSVLSSDLFGSARALKQEINAIAQGDTDIIIGTQLVAKGHNFPNLTVVGVIDADLGLQGSDLRAAERTFQVLRQVAGRAGRSEKKGVALLQTYQPDHPVIRAILSDQEEAFWQAESRARDLAGVPPFGRMAGIILSGSNAEQVFGLGQYLARHRAPLDEIDAQVFGPAAAPIARVRGRYRVRLLVKVNKSAPLQRALQDWIANVKLRGDLRLAIDIDPQSFF